MAEVKVATYGAVAREIEVMIHDPDLFWAFQPSADRLTPDTMHNTGKRHTCTHSNPQLGSREGGRVEGAMVEVESATSGTVPREIEVLVHDPDLFWAFQPSADRLTPDTMHNTGKYHTCTHSNPPHPGV